MPLPGPSIRFPDAVANCTGIIGRESFGHVAMLLLGWDWVYNFGMGIDRCGVWQFKEWKDRNGLRKLSGF